jgi:hypothetical protein
LFKSPYIITDNILVNTGVTLTIEPGVKARFDSGKYLRVDGELIAMGNAANVIIFTSNQLTPAIGDWGYILFSDSSTDAVYDINVNYSAGSILEYCVIEYAGNTSSDNKGAINIKNALPFINKCSVINNSASGIYGIISSGEINILNCTIENNISRHHGGGIYISGGEVNITKNDISENFAHHPGATPTMGGGVCVEGTNGLITHNTISNNRTKTNATNSSMGGGYMPRGMW